MVLAPLSCRPLIAFSMRGRVAVDLEDQLVVVDQVLVPVVRVFLYVYDVPMTVAAVSRTYGPEPTGLVLDVRVVEGRRALHHAGVLGQVAQEGRVRLLSG